MGYLENLPAELLHPILASLEQRDLRALRAASPAFYSFVTPRVFSRMFFNGNPTVPKKLRHFLKRADLRIHLEELIFVTSPLFNEEDCTEEAILRMKRIGRLLARYEDVRIKRVTVFGVYGGMGLLGFLGLTGITTIKYVSGKVVCFHGNSFNVRLYPQETPRIRPLLESLETLNLLVVNDAVLPSVLNFLHDMPNLRGLYFRCSGPTETCRRAPVIDGPDLPLPVTLRKIMLSSCTITWRLLRRDIFRAPRIEELTFVDVNLDSLELYLPYPGPREGVALFWQKFVDDLDAKCSRSGSQMRLTMGWLTELHRAPVAIDDSRLRTVTLRVVDTFTDMVEAGCFTAV